MPLATKLKAIGFELKATGNEAQSQLALSDFQHLVIFSLFDFQKFGFTKCNLKKPRICLCI
jgi:hypothetical protein